MQVTDDSCLYAADMTALWYVAAVCTMTLLALASVLQT